MNVRMHHENPMLDKGGGHFGQEKGWPSYYKSLSLTTYNKMDFIPNID